MYTLWRGELIFLRDASLYRVAIKVEFVAGALDATE